MKKIRQELVMRLIETEKISTLKQLQNLLKINGVSADTATLSRDIREMGIVRASSGNGHVMYTTIKKIKPPAILPATTITSRFIEKIEWTGRLIVIKTITGTAPTVGEIIDNLKWKEFCGTIAGDNTLFIAVSRGYKPDKVIKKLEKELVK